MVEAKENAVSVNAQRANDMRESADIASGARTAPAAQAAPALPTAAAPAKAAPAAQTLVPPPAPTSAPVAPAPDLTSLHVRLLIAAGLSILLFILWVRQRNERA